jgi:hypothetical protein
VVGREVNYNINQIQPLQSHLCGFYVVCFALFRLRIKFERFLSFFNYENLNENDDIVKKMYYHATGKNIKSNKTF